MWKWLREKTNDKKTNTIAFVAISGIWYACAEGKVSLGVAITTTVISLLAWALGDKINRAK